MKRSMVIMVAAGLGLVVLAGELFARGGGGGHGGSGGGRSFSGGRSYGGHSSSRSFSGHAHGASRSVGSRSATRTVQRTASARTSARTATRATTRTAATRRTATQRTGSIVRTSALVGRYAAATSARGLLPLTARGRVRIGGGLGGSGGGNGGDGSGEEMTSEEPTDALYGMEILDMEEGGTAATGGMKVGDVILAINGMATTDFDSMRAALESCGSQAEIEFINVENGQAERIELQVDDSRIGTTVEQVQVQ